MMNSWFETFQSFHTVGWVTASACSLQEHPMQAVSILLIWETFGWCGVSLEKQAMHNFVLTGISAEHHLTSCPRL